MSKPLKTKNMKELKRTEKAFILFIVFAISGCIGFTGHHALAQTAHAEYSGTWLHRMDGPYKDRPERLIHTLKVQNQFQNKFRSEFYAQYGQIWRNALAGASYQVHPGVWLGAGGGISIHRNHLLSSVKNTDTGERTKTWENGEKYSSEAAIAGFVDATWKNFRLIGNLDHCKNTYRYNASLEYILDEKVSVSLNAVRSAGIGGGLAINLLPHVTIRPGWSRSLDIYATNINIGVSIHTNKTESFLRFKK
ncbi:MAG: hypothetical protein KBC42_02540 [Candidatus Pacebacteria bacterium]|nr:hypothetical protein [Candidatus Paceibacterota bacterium]MBP9780778.1 hypothetical protein [Candidatus Paceibacterota bacterium]